MTFRRDDWPVCQATYTHRRIRYDGWTWVPIHIILVDMPRDCYYYNSPVAAMWHRRTGKCSCQKVTNWRRVHAAVSLYVGLGGFFWIYLFFRHIPCKYAATAFFVLSLLSVLFRFFFLPPVKRCPAGAEVSIYRPRVTRSGEIDRENCIRSGGEENTWMTGGLTEKNKRSRFDDK